MVIRVTSQMSQNAMLSNINRTQSSIYDLYNQITSGKRLTNPSQDPMSATQVINMNTQLGELGDWAKNISSARESLSMSYDTLGLVQDNLQRINDLTIQASTGTNSAESLAAIKSEIEQRTRTIGDLANTKYQNEYIFSGTNTQTQPYSIDDTLTTTYSGTPNDAAWQRKLEISQGEEITYNVSGEKVFGNGTNGIFGTLKNLNDALASDPPDFDAIRSQLDDIQGGIRNVSDSMSTITSSVNRLDMTKTINDNSTLSLKTARSALEDTDIASAASDLAMQQVALQASLKVGSQMIGGPTLLNYI